MKLVDVVVNGVRTTVQLSDEAAKAYAPVPKPEIAKIMVKIAPSPANKRKGK
jgi:hypothetical protein